MAFAVFVLFGILFRVGNASMPPIKGTVHWYSNCHQCGRDVCEASNWKFNRFMAWEGYVVGSFVSEAGCDKTEHQDMLRNSDGAIFSVNPTIADYKGILHWVTDCNQCNRSWCNRAVSKKGRFAEKGYLVGERLSDLGCEKLPKKIKRTDLIIGSGRIYFVTQKANKSDK
eukprot:TRINITY_DN571_c0_g1_i1.p1 TRINITY_DN571_c0_g1~~TRINITY_DN571_c0_g1_i1.p1  ORF type:complete len:187 (+),score=13.99 TRINITY_DN571_c0_g1_i1:54-563(+)